MPRSMDRTVSICGAAALGAGIMYLLDPDRGTRRRAFTIDKARRAANLTARGMGTVWRDVGNRSAGLVAEMRNALRRMPADDSKLQARIRSELGLLVQHPRAIEVMVHDGHVTLSGPVFASEMSRCLSFVRSIPGVKSVGNQLTGHESADGIPALQGRAPRPMHRFEFFQRNWSPAARFLAGTAGGSLVLYGVFKKNAGSLIGSLAGAALMARAASNVPLTRL
jgi:hypothetical protein